MNGNQILLLCLEDPRNRVALFQGQWNQSTWLNNAMYFLVLGLFIIV